MQRENPPTFLATSLKLSSRERRRFPSLLFSFRHGFLTLSLSNKAFLWVLCSLNLESQNSNSDIPSLAPNYILFFRVNVSFQIRYSPPSLSPLSLSHNALKCRTIMPPFETQKKIAWWMDTRHHLNMSSLSLLSLS